MQLWKAQLQTVRQLDFLLFGYEKDGLRAKWGPGKRGHYILHYILSGKGVFNGRQLQAGMGFLIRPGKQVAYKADESEPWQYFWISMDGALADEICQNHIHTDGQDVFACDHVALIRSILERLQWQEGDLPPMFGLSVLYRILACHEAQAQPKTNPYVEKAKQMMRQNSHRPMPVTEVAAACGLDDRYLYNLFIRHVGCSPKQYMNDLRMEKAKALLRESSCSVAEVAASVGFEEPLAFSRFFSRHCGLSPTAYRKKGI